MSVADADIVTVPETVPLAGDVIETTGGVTSCWTVTVKVFVTLSAAAERITVPFRLAMLA